MWFQGLLITSEGKIEKLEESDHEHLILITDLGQDNDDEMALGCENK